MKSTLTTLIVLVLILLIVGIVMFWFVKQSEVKELQESAAGQALQGGERQATYTDLDGNALDLSDNLGQIVVAFSWASWCPQCADQLQLLTEFKNEVDAPIKILAINRGEDKVIAERYLKTLELSDEVSLVLDPDDHFYDSIAGYAMPETIVYTKNGDISSHFRGDITKERLQDAVGKVFSTE